MRPTRLTIPVTVPELINLGRVARLLDLKRTELVDLTTRVEALYHRKVVPVGKKRRIIDIPYAELKVVQRSLHDNVFSKLAVADSVYSVGGRGVIKNAQQHLNNPYMAVLDIADCFPTITVAMIREALNRHGFDPLATRYITRLVTLRGRLPQGPPSSPGVMNIVLSEIDAELGTAALVDGATYTRYMDDMCFSGVHDLCSLATDARVILRRHGFDTNPAKTRRWGPADRHTITKIVVSSELSPTPEYLFALTTELERDMCGRSVLSRDDLEGRIAWVIALNPALGERLRRRWRRTRRALAS